jgi:hypothetical protein
MSTQGAEMKPDPESVFRALRPDGLDHLTAEAYTRRRDQDVARLTATSPRRSGRRRRPAVRFRLIVGAAMAACLAAGAVAILSTGRREDTPQVHRSAVATPPIDARTFLLASARTAEKAPATTGEYWYTKSRTTWWGPEAFPTRKNPRSGSTKPTDQGLRLSSPGTVASTEESWVGHGTRARTITGIDTVTKVAPADRAALKAFGPASVNPLVPTTRTVDDHPMREDFSIGSHQVTMAQLARLTTDQKRLEAQLRREYRAGIHDPLQRATFGEMVWDTAQDLLSGPIRPGTRAALYRILAKQPDIKLVGAVTDPLGRPGMALISKGDARPVPGRLRAAAGNQLIIDPATAQLLARVTYLPKPDGQAGPIDRTEAYLTTGWTDRIGQRP